MKLLISNPSAAGKHYSTSPGGHGYTADRNGNLAIDYADWGYFADLGFNPVEPGVGLSKSFTATFPLSNVTLVAGGLLTIPHGLGATPTRVWAELHNVTAEGGYLPGDCIDLPQGYAGSGYGPLIYSNATNIYLAAEAATIAPWATDYLGAQNLTAAKWNIVVKAFLIT